MSTVDHTAQSGIYQIRNLVNGKVYIGSAINIRRRWRAHRGLLGRQAHHNRHLQRAWVKDGEDRFVFEILELVQDKEDLIRVEQEHIDRIRPFDDEIGYNVCPTAASPLGVKRSPETRAKLSAIGKRQMEDPEMRAKVSAANKGKSRRLGFKHSAESKAKMRESTRMRLADPESRARISESSRTSSAKSETRLRMCEAAKRRMSDPEIRRKISDSLKGRTMSAECKAKISEALKGRPRPEHVRRAISETRRKRFSSVSISTSGGGDSG